MGIDGIGKRGGAQGITPPDVSSKSAVGGAQKTGKSFEAALRPPSGVAGAEAVRGSNALEDFAAGRIDMNGYLDQKVSAATVHLEGLPPADLAQVRSMLREKIASDPGFVELVQQATGQLPQAQGE